MNGMPHGYQLSTMAAGTHRSMAFAPPCDMYGKFNAESIGADLLTIPVCDSNSLRNGPTILPPGGMLAARMLVSQACPPWQLGPINLLGGASHSRLYSPWHDSVPAIGCHHLVAAPHGKTSTHDPCNIRQRKLVGHCGDQFIMIALSTLEDCTQHIGEGNSHQRHGHCMPTEASICMIFSSSWLCSMAEVYTLVYIISMHACTHLLPVLGP